MIDSCLEALAMHAPEARVIVVDNASTDGTVERVRRRADPTVSLIANTVNRGFAGGANQAIAQIPQEHFVLLLNPDAEILTPLGALEEACGRSGMAAGRLADENGNSQKGFTIRRFPTPLTLIFETLGVNRVWPGNPVNRRYRYLDRDLEMAGPVEQPAGAFVMFPYAVWERLGGFDERFYPVWFEDVDFCWRAAELGYRAEYIPAVQARHRGGHSVNRLSPGTRATHWCVSLLRYAAKHFRPLSFRVICVAVVLGAIPRMGLAALRNQNNQEDVQQNLRPPGSNPRFSLYFNIIAFSSQCFWSPERVWRPI